MCPTLLTCSFVTFDRKIKRSNLNVVISRSRLSTCSCSEFRLSSFIASVLVDGLMGSAFPPKLRYRLSTGGRHSVNALVID